MIKQRVDDLKAQVVEFASVKDTVIRLTTEWQTFRTTDFVELASLVSKLVDGRDEDRRERLAEKEETGKQQRDTRRWVIGIAVAVFTACLLAAVAIFTAGVY